MGHWFPKKRFGWGWGPPRNLEGWIVLIAWMLLLVIRRRSLSGLSAVAFFVGMIAVLGLIVAFKGEPPGRGNWRIR